MLISVCNLLTAMLCCINCFISTAVSSVFSKIVILVSIQIDFKLIKSDDLSDYRYMSSFQKGGKTGVRKSRERIVW